MLGSVDSYGHLIVSKIAGEGILFVFYLNHSGFPRVENYISFELHFEEVNVMAFNYDVF